MTQDFESWTSEWAEEIAQSQAFTTSPLPAEASEIQENLSRTMREYPRMAALLADVERFITVTRASETLAVKADPKFADLTAQERKVVVESRLADIVRARDILKATVAALKERSFALLNQRNFEREALRMAGHGEA